MWAPGGLPDGLRVLEGVVASGGFPLALGVVVVVGAGTVELKCLVLLDFTESAP